MVSNSVWTCTPNGEWLRTEKGGESCGTQALFSHFWLPRSFPTSCSFNISIRDSYFACNPSHLTKIYEKKKKTHTHKSQRVTSGTTAGKLTKCISKHIMNSQSLSETRSGRKKKQHMCYEIAFREDILPEIRKYHILGKEKIGAMTRREKMSKERR